METPSLAPPPSEENDNLTIETPDDPPLEVDRHKAELKLRGLGPPYWHHHDNERAQVVVKDDKLDKAQLYLEEQEALLKESRQRLSREQWRMKQLEDNRAHLSEKIKAVTVKLQEEKLSPVGAPRHLDEELLALNEDLALTTEEMAKQQQCIYDVSSAITACENEVLRAAFYAPTTLKALTTIKRKFGL